MSYRLSSNEVLQQKYSSMPTARNQFISFVQKLQGVRCDNDLLFGDAEVTFPGTSSSWRGLGIDVPFYSK